MIFVIMSNDDGVRIHVMADEKFKAELNAGDYGDDVSFVTDPKELSNAGYWGHGPIMVIRGDIIAPHPVAKVTEWEL